MTKITRWIGLLVGVFLLLVGIFLLTLSPHAEARDASQVALFRKTHACPSTQQFTGACPGWVVNHKWPLCARGEDTPDNMEWQEVKPSYQRDVEERRICKTLHQWANHK